MSFGLRGGFFTFNRLLFRGIPLLLSVDAVNNLRSLVQSAQHLSAIDLANHIRARPCVHSQCLYADASVYDCDEGGVAWWVGRREWCGNF